MIVTEISGGLGNQMFKYAMAKNLTLKNKVDLKLDVTWFEKEKVNEASRNFGLNVFKISEEKANNQEIIRLKNKKTKNGKKFILYNLFFANKSIYIKESYYKANKIISSNNIYLNGAWQSEKYFKDIRKELLEIFSLKNQFIKFKENLKSEIKNSNSVSLHIRRSDYLIKSHKYKICNLQYYKKAINKIILTEKNIKIFVFSDDIEWAKNNLKTDFSAIFINGNKDYEDLILMSLCKHNIIANSSFSWWGAWLNKNPNKIVIAPKNWFVNRKRNTKNLTPSEWIKI